MTQLRKEVLDYIRTVEKPVNAKVIAKRIDSDPNLSSIYRALDYLESKNFIQGISFSRTKYYYPKNATNCGHFIHCRECNEVQPIQECFLNHDKLDGSITPFEVTGHLLLLEGYCPECKAYLQKRNNLKH